MTTDNGDRSGSTRTLPGADRMRELTGRALETIDTAKTRAEDTLAATRAKGEAVVHDAKDKAYRAADETNRIFQEHPISAVAAAVAIGAVAGIFLPRLHMTTRAVALGSRVLKVAATAEVAQSLMTRLTDAGQTLRDGASHAAEAAPRRAREAAHAVADTGVARAVRRGTGEVTSRVRRVAKAAADEVSSLADKRGS